MPVDGYRAYQEATARHLMGDRDVPVLEIPVGFRRPLPTEVSPAALAAGYAAWAADRDDPGGAKTRGSEFYVDDEGVIRVRTQAGGDASAAIFADYAASIAAEKAHQPDIVDAMCSDLERLKEATFGWSDFRPVPVDFFPSVIDFSRQLQEHRSELIEVHSAFSLKLLELVQLRPERMFLMSPREFEELIADIFTGFGFAVELTSRTRDGGRDLIAIGKGIAEVKYLVECKRYAPGRHVGIAFVQRLHGVTVSEGATKGILATTSDSTDPAKEHLEKHRYLLEGRAFNGLLDWLRQVDKLNLAPRGDSRYGNRLFCKQIGLRESTMTRIRFKEANTPGESPSEPVLRGTGATSRAERRAQARDAAQQGLICGERGDLSAAIQNFQLAIEIDPEYADAHYNLGEAYLRMGNIPEGIGSTRRALALGAGDPMAHVNLGMALATQGKIEEALVTLNRAVEIDPNNAMARFNRGLLFLKAMRDDEARRDWERYLELEPESDRADHVRRILRRT